MKRIRDFLLFSAAAWVAGWSLAALPAGAQLARTSFNVTAQVPAACVMTATDVNFGLIDLPTGAQSDTTIDISCGQNLTAQLTLTSQNTALPQRFQMAGSGATTQRLRYELCQDAACTILIQSGVAFPVTLTSAGNTLVLPARVPAAQAVSPDSYTDVVQVSLDL